MCLVLQMKTVNKCTVVNDQAIVKEASDLTIDARKEEDKTADKDLRGKEEDETSVGATR